MKTLVLLQHHVERILKKTNLSYQIVGPYTRRKLHWNKSLTVKICLENFVRNVLKENKLWNRTVKSAFWVCIGKKIKLNLILTNPELFIIYWTWLHLFWFLFPKLLLIFCQSSWQEISILKKQFLIRSRFSKLNCKIKIWIFQVLYYL